MTELYDWGKFEPEEREPFLVEEEERREGDRIATAEEWSEIAEEMIESAKECERAARS